MNKTTLISGIVIIALVSVVIAIFTSEADKETKVSGTNKPSTSQIDKVTKDSTQNLKPEDKTQIAKTDKTKSNKVSKKITTAKPKAKKPVAEEESETKVSRVRWPGMKYRMVRVTKEEKIELVNKMLESVGLAPPEHFLKRYPHELSGGEKQRVPPWRHTILAIFPSMFLIFSWCSSCRRY